MYIKLIYLLLNLLVYQTGLPSQISHYLFAKLMPTMTMELKVLQVGGISFVLAPYEMFGHHGTDIKTQSPYENTFIITCAEGSWNYIASTDAFDFNAYESYCCYFEQGTAEKLVEEYLNMLTELKN